MTQPLRRLAPPDEHLVALPGTEWRIWRDAVLRTTGFPADGLRRLAADDCAATADAYLDGKASDEEFGKALREAQAHCSREVHAIAADPLFREAVTWQSASVLSALDGIAKAGPEPPRNRKQRERERIVARYWQRYCAKAETIGFFGPVCWVTIDPDATVVTAKAGPNLLRDRRIFLEHWALASYADRISADPRARRWLPPALQPHLTMDGAKLLDPARPPLRLSPAEQAVLARCDGRRLACAVARAVLADSRSGLRKEDDVYLMLDRLAERGLLRWNLDLPVSLDSELLLRERLTAIGNPEVRAQALAGLARLCAGRDAVAGAVGNPDALAGALRQIEKDFTDLAGAAPRRRLGQTYAARTVCAEDTTRDLDVTIGAGILKAVAAPLAILLEAARWTSAAMAEAYLAALRGLHAELSADLGTPAVPLGQLWFLAQGLFYGSAQRPADLVTAELGQRLRSLYGVEPSGTADRLDLSSDRLRPRLATIFPAQHPGWSAARIHSPDLLICAQSLDAVRRGDFTVVLSELHAAWASCASGVFVAAHPDRARLRTAYATDIGIGRIDPLLPVDWPRHSPRLAFTLDSPDDIQLGFTPAPGADPDRLLPISAVSVMDTDGQLVATGPAGRGWPLAEVFARPLAEVTVDAFKLAGSGAHTPRITIDRVVVAREAWRTTVAAAGLTKAADDRERYLAARRWRRELGLPDHVFVMIGTEQKPVFADLTSPLYVNSLCAMLRAASADSGVDVPVTLTEMLPTCGQAWVPDAAGRRYFSELRLHVCDPQQPRCGPGGRP